MEEGTQLMLVTIQFRFGQQNMKSEISEIVRVKVK